ncbi:MAG: MCE family protein [Actinomycetes bacterium]
MTGLGFAGSPTRRRVTGLVFLALLAALVGLAVAAYRQAFTPVVHVTLLTDSVGNQLDPQADVKLRGLIVGEVRSISSNGRGARLDLALDPHTVGLIPADVQARLLPKTLFGERFVDLVVPRGPLGTRIAAGDVIPQDRSRSAVELEQVFDQALPLLRTVQPAKLNATLNALATALEGRGERLGANLQQVDAYLRGLNPSLPTLTHDISALADVATTYDDAAPDLLALLRGASVTSRTVVDERDQLAAFLRSTTGLAATAGQVVSENGDRIIRLGELSRPTLELLAAYSPEYPCLLKGLADWQPRINQAFAGGQFHITLSLAPQRPGYAVGEEPDWGETQGPQCHGLPDPAVDTGAKLRDGTSPSRSIHGGAPATPGGSPLSGLAGTAQEQQVVSSLVAPFLGVPADKVPPIADLLFGPLARGTSVSQR